jgi:hypothetical protein
MLMMMADATRPSDDQLLARLHASKAAGEKAAKLRARALRKIAHDHFDRTRIGNRIKPTPETAAKLKPCPIGALHREGTIDAEERNAAYEIEHVHTRVLAGMFARAGKLEWAPAARRDGPSLAVATAYASRYAPWADELAGVRRRVFTATDLARIFPHLPADRLAQLAARTGPRVQLAHRVPGIALAVTIDMAVDGKSGREIDAYHLWRKGKAVALIKDALALYVRIAGGHVPNWDPDERRVRRG